MGSLAAGSVVLVPFPFSDLSRSKLRPAVLLANAGRGDFILRQVTSNAYADERAVALGPSDFAQGSLQRMSYARPGKLFTANDSLVVDHVGMLHSKTRDQIVDRIIEILRDGSSA